MDGEVHDDAVALVVRVERVRVVERVDLEPAHRPAGTAHDTDPHRVPLVPLVRHSGAGFGARHVERDRDVHDDDMTARQGEVVHHRRVRDRDPRDPDDLAGVVDHQVTYVVPGGVVRDGVQLVGPRVVLGVRREGTFKGGAEVVRAHGVEVAVELVRQRPALLEGEDAALVRDDVGVGGEVVGRHLARVRLAQLLCHGSRSDPPIAVPLGAAVAQPDAVHHPVALHPVVRPGILQTEDVRTDPQITAVQLAGYPARHRQPKGRQLLGDRRERPLQERVRDPAGQSARGGLGDAGPAARAVHPHHTARRRDGRAPQHPASCVTTHRNSPCLDRLDRLVREDLAADTRAGQEG